MNSKLIFTVFMALFLLSFVSAGDVEVVMYFEQAALSTNLTINNGDNFGLSFSANSLNELSMNIVVDLLDSNGNAIFNMWTVFTNARSYSDYFIWGSGAYANPGNYTIRATVTGASGSTDTYSLDLAVLAPTPGNNAPNITSTPSTDMDEETNYTYQVVATDADNDTLTYSLTQAPTWLSIDTSGLVTGTAPDINGDYNYSITIEVSDGLDFDSQTFPLLVRDLDAPDTTAPVITVVTPVDGGVYTSSSLLFEITTDEDVAVAGFSLDGATIPTPMDEITPRNFSRTVTLTDGNHSVTFYALDMAGNIGQTTVNFAVDTSGASDTIAPVVTIVSPTNSQTYNTSQITVDFTAVDLNLNTCYYSLNGAANVTTACNTPFNITALEGTNTITVYATDNSGNIGSATVTFNVDTSSSGNGDSKKKTTGSRIIYDSDGDEQYLSQYGPKTTVEDEEVLGAVSQPSSFGSLWFWILIAVLILIVAVIILWLRR